MSNANNWSRNNLDKALSPYLRAHHKNPIWWQEWSSATITRAKETNRPILASVGYSTCHWCHVMARESFSDQAVAELINKHFVAVKIDREERPDIDHYLMSFLVATTGQGGWPLNAFLTPDAKPFFAMTYAPKSTTGGRPGLLELLPKVVDFYKTRGDHVKEFSLGRTESATHGDKPVAVEEAQDAVKRFLKHYDGEIYGFGTGQKFPPHASLLYLLHVAADSGLDPGGYAKEMAQETLDIMATRGLHDHLEGGFFRYCTDRAWTIPHFEKMLYDQAMALWNYALGARVFDNPVYAMVAEDTVDLLYRRFEIDGLFAAAIDADTDHEEGAVYLFRDDELQDALSGEEYRAITERYEVGPRGNFEGKIHLVAKNLGEKSAALRAAEDKLRAIRAARKQPLRDEKSITSLNALAAVALICAGRYLDKPDWIQYGVELFHNLSEKHLTEGKLTHASLKGRLGGGPALLEDYGAMLLAAGYVLEESGEQVDSEPTNGDIARHIDFLAARLQDFKTDGTWVESLAADFPTVAADSHDAPYPSGVAMAEVALVRRSLLQTGAAEIPENRPVLRCDFANLGRLAAGGVYWIVGAPQRPPWTQLPLLTVYHRAEEETTCHGGVCTPGIPDPPETTHLSGATTVSRSTAPSGTTNPSGTN